MVALAITEGRIGADVREDYVKLALQDYSLAEKTLRAIPAKVSLAASVTKIGDALIPADRQGWTYLHWLKDDPAGLAKIKAENPEAFEAIKKVRN